MKKKFVLNKHEKILWLKVHAINPDSMHKDGPTSWELAAIIQASWIIFINVSEFSN